MTATLNFFSRFKIWFSTRFFHRMLLPTVNNEGIRLDPKKIKKVRLVKPAPPLSPYFSMEVNGFKVFTEYSIALESWLVDSQVPFSIICADSVEDIESLPDCKPPSKFNTIDKFPEFDQTKTDTHGNKQGYQF